MMGVELMFSTVWMIVVGILWLASAYGWGRRS